MRKTLAQLGLIALFSSFWPLLSGQPTLVVDQEQTLIDAGVALAVGGNSEQELAQTVTVGVPGRLTEVWLPVGCASGKLVLEIQGVTPAGLPNGVVLKSRQFAATLLPEILPPTLQQFRLGRALRFAAGDRFAIVVSNEKGSCGLSPGPAGDSYGAGAAFFDARPNPPGWNSLIINGELVPRDLAFQTVMIVTP